MNKGISVFLNKILKAIFPYLRIIIAIGGIILIYKYFRWIGFKGFIGFASGMMLMAYTILSKNPVVMWVIDMTKSDKYIWEIMKK